MPDQSSLGDLIRQQRAALGLTQARLAELVGKSPSTVRSWERDRTRPADEASLSALGAVLGLTEEQVQQAMATEQAPKLDVPTTTPEDSNAPAPEVESESVDRAIEREPEPPTRKVDPIFELGSAVRASEIDPVETTRPAVASEAETVVSEGFSSPSTDVVPSRRFRFSDLAAILRPTSAVASRPRVPSYLDDPGEIRTYRFRTIMTAAVLVFMVIVLLWAIGEARDAFGLIY